MAVFGSAMMVPTNVAKSSGAIGEPEFLEQDQDAVGIRRRPEPGGQLRLGLHLHSSPNPLSFWPRLASMNKVSAAAVTTISIVA